MGKKRRAVSPVLATVIIFGLIITGVMVTFIQVVPFIEQAQSEQTISSVKNSFIDLDETIESLISESGNPGGFRTLLFTKPAGTLEFNPKAYYISLYLEDKNVDFVHDIIDFQEIGMVDWVYSSPRSILPRGTSKYLTGPAPYKTREQAFITGMFATSDNQDLTNLVLSHQTDRKHHISLDYRVSIYLTISTQPVPEIRLQIFLISLTADFNSIHNQYKQITVHVSKNVSAPEILAPPPFVSKLDLIIDRTYSSTPSSTLLWSTSQVHGLNNLNDFDIVVQLLKYDINLKTT
ncbi:hypothetical protein CEE45_06775 [Candidatus Heimdallarchaeota archaeon B3_Heim]|nr:MAG: hypothetical protein CEE45_06775 [Candidatus Heimdallarchaeota archaeon B3_Heim]